jgi:hypothetical protein
MESVTHGSRVWGERDPVGYAIIGENQEITDFSKRPAKVAPRFSAISEQKPYTGRVRLT